MELIIFSLVFAATVALIAALRPAAERFGLVDHPGGRKRHRTTVPLCGGLAITTAVILFGLTLSGYGKILGLVAGMTGLTALGVMDDRVHVPAPARLLIEIALVLTVMCWWQGVTLNDLGVLFGGHVTVVTGAFASVLTVFATVSLINGINMIDGIDGLAGGFAFLTFGALSAVAFATQSDALGILLILMAAVAGFLVFNLRAPWRHAASVFLGDAGSLTLGFALVWFAVDMTQGHSAVLRPIAMVWLFALPILDTVHIVLRRLARGQNPLEADRHHLHHLFREFGLTPGKTVAVWLLLAAVLASVGLVGEALRLPEAVLFGGFLGLFALYLASVALAWRHFGMERAAVERTAS